MEPSDLALLATLDALLQESSVTRAARRAGVSTPAMSHALARIRDRLRDPILVRAGRSMVLTPKAERMKARVHEVVMAAEGVLSPEEPFEPARLRRVFLVHATDYVLLLLGAAVDRRLAEAAPHARVRFVPNTPDDPTLLRDGGSDLAIGIYGSLPQEMRSRRLVTDRFVCVVRRDHPVVRQGLTLERYLALDHVQVAPRGRPGGYIDDLLRARGLERHVARALPYFGAALALLGDTSYVLTVSERLASRLAPGLGLVVLPPPLPVRPYALSLVWHPRVDADPAHRFLRDVFVRAAREVAGDRHDDARTRLDPTDPTSGESRKQRARRRRGP